MGSSNSSLCCYCRTQYEHCCGIQQTHTDAKGCAETNAYGEPSPFYSIPNSPTVPAPDSLFRGHCDDESLRSYFQEITCFCPSNCHRRRRKQKSRERKARVDKRSSFTFHDVTTPNSCQQFGGKTVHQKSAEDLLCNRSSSNQSQHEKSRRSSQTSVMLRARMRQTPDRYCPRHQQGPRRCLPPPHCSRKPVVPPFPLHLDTGGDREAMTKNHSTYIMSTNSQADMDGWIKALRRAIRSPSGSGIFGKELNKTMRYEEQVDNKLPPGMRKRREAPYIIETCCEFIRKNGGFYEEGLFRLPGQADDVKELQDSFDMGNRPSFEKSTDTHTVASLMKSFLRELPEPLVPYAFYSPLVDAAKMINAPNPTNNFNTSTILNQGAEDDEEAAKKARDKIKEQLEQLPKENFNLLRYLCRFLDEVQQHSKHNKMDVDNLALVFGPNILRSEKEEPMTMMSNASHVQRVMSEFIRSHKYLFPDDEPGSGLASSIPDVAAIAASRDIKGESADAFNAGATVSPHLVQGVSTEGFNTMTTQTTTSPPGTIGVRHITDDSGTGSLGPTPDNTSKRAVGPASAHSARPRPSVVDERGVDGRPVLPNKPLRPLLARGNSDADKRESFYDNVTQSSESSVAYSAVKHRRSGQSPVQPGRHTPEYHDGSKQSSHARLRSAVPSSVGSSTNAVAGSSTHSLHSYDALSCSPTMSAVYNQSCTPNYCDESPKGPKPPLRKKRSKKSTSSSLRQSSEKPRSHSRFISDEESNTESVAADGGRSTTGSRHGSVSSVSDSTFPKDRGVQHLTKHAKRPLQPPPPPPSGLKGQIGNLSRRNTNSSSFEPPTYEQLQETVGLLEEKLYLKAGELEARAKAIEDQLLKPVQDLRCFASSEFLAYSQRMGQGRHSQSSDISAFRQNWRPRAVSSVNGGDSTSYAESGGEAAELDSRLFDVDSKMSGLQDTRTSEEQVVFLKKCVSEERRLRQMVEIQLRNEQRARVEAEERNEQLQKEMREFFRTFGSMFSNSDTSSVQG